MTTPKPPAFRLTPYETYQAYLLHNDDRWRRQLYAGMSRLAQEQSFGELGKYIFVDEQGRVRDTVSSWPPQQPPTSSDPAHPALWNDWSWVCLEPAAARSLQNEMVELFKRYTAQHFPGNQGYIVRMAISPVML